MAMGACLGCETLCAHPYNLLRPHHNWCGLYRERSSDFWTSSFSQGSIRAFCAPGALLVPPPVSVDGLMKSRKLDDRRAKLFR
jgi:hypothetical protein